jgi:hypothetical protein
MDLSIGIPGGDWAPPGWFGYFFDFFVFSEEISFLIWAGGILAVMPCSSLVFLSQILLESLTLVSGRLGLL